jgi:hypothetical protein
MTCTGSVDRNTDYSIGPLTDRPSSARFLMQQTRRGWVSRPRSPDVFGPFVPNRAAGVFALGCLNDQLTGLLGDHRKMVPLAVTAQPPQRDRAPARREPTRRRSHLAGPVCWLLTGPGLLH